jgi:hypothetical protein
MRSELARVRREVDFLEGRALTRWQALTPPTLTGQPPSADELHTLARIAAISLFDPEGYIRILFGWKPHLQALPLCILRHCGLNRHIERRELVRMQWSRSLWFFCPPRRKVISGDSIEKSVRPRIGHDGA